MVREGKLIRVYNGIDFKQAPEGARELFREKYNIPQDVKLLGMASRIHYWKGQMEFLQIAKYLNKDRKNIHYVIAGDPYPGYEYLLDNMKQYIRENNLGDYVHYIGFCDDMPSFYAAIDSFMLPSTGPDPFPTVLLEAMHAGKPVVCTITGGSREIVEKNETGTYISMVSWLLDMLQAAQDSWRTLILKLNVHLIFRGQFVPSWNNPYIHRCLVRLHCIWDKLLLHISNIYISILHDYVRNLLMALSLHFS
jgi:glycogen synthase